MPQTTGRVMLTPRETAKRLGYSKEHLNRLLREGKLGLKKYYPYEGALPRYAEDEVEALKQGGAS